MPSFFGRCRWPIRSSLCSSQIRFSLMETGSSLQNRLYDYPQFERFQSQSQTLSGIFGGTGLGRITVGFHGASGIAQGDRVQRYPLHRLKIAPQYGRFFSVGEDRAGAPVAVISDRYWRSRFGAERSIVRECDHREPDSLHRDRHHPFGLFGNLGRKQPGPLGSTPRFGPSQARQQAMDGVFFDLDADCRAASSWNLARAGAGRT